MDSPSAQTALGLSVIMPCHDEAGIIQESLHQTLSALRTGYPETFEIVVADDGSSDGTSDRAEALAAEDPRVRVLRYPLNGGKGSVLRKAFMQSRGDLICFLDGDFDLHPRHIAPFVELLERSGADIVVGSKRHPESRIDYPTSRRVMSKGYEVVVRALFGMRLRDTQTGVKVFRREVLETILPLGLVNRYAFDAELLVLASRCGFKIVEAPIEMDFRGKFGSGVDPRAIVQMSLDTLGVFYRLNVSRFYELPSVRIERAGRE